ncbi:MAG TPA: fatty acid desaturase [Pirellulales bacterium]|jgi:stearoyl-CoA desaturase (delta-9 desaturase)|nr:fatty acid desaturase [Pirellulales bacterium]
MIVADAPTTKVICAPPPAEAAPQVGAASHVETAPHVAPGPVELSQEPQPPQLAQPERWKISWPYTISLTVYHVVALLALAPWFFSWTGVVLCIAGLYVFGTLGINLCFHRLLTHRGFTCPLWLERSLAVLGLCSLQDTPARWVAIHRLHHQHSDEEPDPHSPLVRFFWAHMGWLFFENPTINNAATYDRYARDVLRDPFYFWFERKLRWFTINLWQLAAFFVAGWVAGWCVWRDAATAWQYAASVTLWGVVVRTVIVWHITWSVNSVTHLWGYRNYETGENSRNNWFVALVSNGEGWHNNHHADQRSARHGHRWWEFDVTYLTIRFLYFAGLASDVVVPRQPSVRGGP